jgi:hypothetical protein
MGVPGLIVNRSQSHVSVKDRGNHPAKCPLTPNMQQDCNSGRSCLLFLWRVTYEYANYLVVGRTDRLRAGFRCPGLMCEHAHDVLGQRCQGIRDFLQGLLEHVGLVPRQSRPDMRCTRIRHGRRRQIRQNPSDWLQIVSDCKKVRFIAPESYRLSPPGKCLSDCPIPGAPQSPAQQAVQP